jgi:hypothetical protein
VLGVLLEIINKINELKILAILPVIVVFLRLSIDNINMRGVEKVLLTNSKRLVIQLSIAMVVALFFSIFIGASVYFSEDVEPELKKNITLFIIISFFTTSMIVLPLYFFLMFLANLLIFKEKYYIYLSEEGKKKWFISRKLSNKAILLCDEYGNYKFLEESNLYNHTIYRVVQEKNYKIVKCYIWIRNNHKTIIGLISPIIIGSFLATKFLQMNSIINLILSVIVFIGIIGIAAVVIVTNTVKHIIGCSSSIEYR